MNAESMEARVRATMRNAGFGENAQYNNLGGHASLRIYWRVNAEFPLFQDETSLIAMVLPEGDDALKSDEATSGAKPTELPFLSVQRMLKSWALRVPEVVHNDQETGVVLLEDLGDVMFEHVVLNQPDRIEALYQEAIDLLAHVQRKAHAATDRSCICWSRSFDRDLLRWELDHYIEWGVDALDKTTGLDAAMINTAFETLLDELETLETTLVLRDYQSRNIMRKNDEWVLIDFQDALVGPTIYDLVALLRDSYIELEPDMVDRLVDYYVDQDLPWTASRDETHQAFHLQTIQRKLKDTGRFIYIDKVKHNPDFLPYYDPSLGYVRNAIAKLPDYDNEIWRAITLQ